MLGIMFASCDDNFRIHFIGLGGIGMSGIAEILHHLGYQVQGSDAVRSANIERLEKLGITVFAGHDESNVRGVDIVVYSSAIKSDNVELAFAKENHIPILTRAEMLAQLVHFKKSVVVSGSHGKTTVTSLCASVLEMGGIDPTVINGGVINAYQTNAKLGDGDWVVIESDESDGSFTKFKPTVGIITNIDREHTNHYGSFENLKNAFLTFLENIPFYGVGIVSIDDPNVVEVIESVKDRKILTYSISKDANFKAVNIRKNSNGAEFDVEINCCVGRRTIDGFSIPLLGEHNIKNALAAIVVGVYLKINDDIIKNALAVFGGVKRRFSRIGEYNGILFIDDYAHHPTEIKAVIESARQTSSGKVVIVCQPHRFTRLINLFDEFVEKLSLADKVIMLPVYKADEKESGSVDSVSVLNSLKENDIDCEYAESSDELLGMIRSFIDSGEINTGDIIIFAGAGSISKIGFDIREKIEHNE